MKHVIITGSTRGIGFGLAKQFLDNGCKVTINGRSETSINEALKRLKDVFPNAKVQGFKGDVMNREDLKKLWVNAFNNFGEVDIWINNAGVDQKRKNIWELNEEEVKEVLDINILGVINGSTIAINEMLQQGKGFVYNMEGFGSDGMMLKGMTLYGSSKRTVRYFTSSLAKELEGKAVKIATLSPGMVVTDFLINSLSENKGKAEKNKKVYNILADDVDTVTEYLVKKILENDKDNKNIVWLTKPKIAKRFMLAPFKKRDLFKDYDLELK